MSIFVNGSLPLVQMPFEEHERCKLYNLIKHFYEYLFAA